MSIIPSQTKVYSGFDPRTIPGCQLWLDAADYSTFTLSGSSITQWADKSGKGYHAVGGSSGTGTYSATGFNTSYPTVQISTTGNMRAPAPAGTFPNGFTFFFVFQKTGSNTGTFDTVITRTDAYFPSPLDAYSANNGNTSILVGSSAGIASAVIGGNYDLFRRTSPTLVCISAFSPVTTVSLSVNGSNTDYSSTGTYVDGATNIYIGYRQNNDIKMNGNISEIIAYANSSAFSSVNRQQIEGYLAWKWGIKSNLPATHPFKLTPVVSRPFQPIDIANCSVWLDAADISTLTLSGSNVTQWRDKSGTGLVLAQGTNAPTLGPLLNNSQTIAFTTTQSMLSTGNYSSTPTQTWFLVFNAYNNTNNNRFFLAHGGADISVSNGEYFYGGNGTLWADYRTPNARQFIDSVGLGTTPFNSAQWYITNVLDANTTTDTTSIGFRIDGTDRTISYNGGSSNLTVSGTYSVPLRINTAAAANNYIAEIIIYNAALTKPQIQQIEMYLANKWGLRGNLPSTHPFKLYPPITALFTPLQISGCALWLDAADATTLTLSGSNVTQWNDKSGNGFNATGTVNPTYDTTTKYILFNGSSQYFTLPNGAYPFGNTPYSIFVVSYTRNAANPQWVISGGGNTSTNQNLGLLYYTTNAVYHSWWINEFKVDNSITNNVPAIINISYSTLRSIIINGGTATTNNPGAIRNNPNSSNFIGRRSDSVLQLLDGGLGECIIFNSELSTTNRQLVEGYLANKWGLKNSLPSTHPFKTIAP